MPSEPAPLADPVRRPPFYLACPECGCDAEKPCPGTVRSRAGCEWKRMIGETLDGTPLHIDGAVSGS